MSDLCLLDLLDTFPDFEKGSAPGDAVFNLDRTRFLLRELKHPDLAYRIVHVAGTKGKGSVATMTASILQASGLRVGLYTSPHLLDFTERIRVNGVPIKEDVLVSVLERDIIPVLSQIPTEMGQATHFEVITVLALRVFRQMEVEAVVLEVGLGGSLDATNAIHWPDVVALTPISLDHTAILGKTVEAIAHDKVGVVKDGTTVVCSPQSPAVREIIASRCRQMRSDLIEYERWVQVRRSQSKLAGQNLQVSIRGREFSFRLALAGRHQAENAGTATLVADSFLRTQHSPALLAGQLSTAFQTGPSNGKLVEPRRAHHADSCTENFRVGLEQVRIPGRFDIIHTNPLVLTDVAHNQASALALAATVDEVVGRDIVYVVGMASDKDHRSFFEALGPTASAIICVQAHHPRALDAPRLAQSARSVLEVPVHTAGTTVGGIELAVSLNPSAIVVTGSFHTVAEAMRGIGLQEPDLLRT